MARCCFNPRPTKKSGEPSPPRIVRSSHTGFNPRPTKKSGEPRIPGREVFHDHVSIRARQKNRANHFIDPGPEPEGAVSIRARQKNRANRLVLLAGRRRLNVSIRARQKNRANRGSLRVEADHLTVSIRARQKNRANPLTGLSGTCGIGRFNPRPTKKSGEPSLATGCGRNGFRFNPRPTKKSGEPAGTGTRTIN